MFHLLAWLIGLVLGGLLFVAGLLWTETGNTVARPLIEKGLHFYFPEAKLMQLHGTFEKISVSGTLSPDTQFMLEVSTQWSSLQVSGNGQLISKDLNQLTHQLAMPLSGEFNAEISFELNRTQQTANVMARLALSQLNWQFIHLAEQPKQLTVRGDLRLDELTYLVQQPTYATGNWHVDGAFSLVDTDDWLTLNGQLQSYIKDGLLKAQPLQSVNIALPQDTPFTLNSNTDILNGKTLSIATFDSRLARITIDQVQYTLKHDDVNGQHQLILPELNKLSFMTPIPLQGRLESQGDFRYRLPTRHLEATANSTFLAGKLTAKLNGNQLRLNLHDGQTEALTHLLMMPKVIRSSINGDATYQLDTQQGKFDFLLQDGQLLPNEFSQLLNIAAKFDITREVYEKISIQGTLIDQIVLADLDMRSQLTHIQSQQSRLDLKPQQIRSQLQVDIKGFTLPITLSGALKHPDIDLDLSKVAGKQIESVTQEKLDQEKKKIEDQLKQLKLPSLGF